MKKELKTTKAILRSEIGWSWPTFVLRSTFSKRRIYARTRWADMEGVEAEFAKRISLAPAIYSGLKDRIGQDRAYESMRRILVTVGLEEQWDHLNSLDLSGKEGMERLMAFHDLMERVGMARFNTKERVREDSSVCHFRITRCMFHDFFSETGTPELTKMFCEVDRQFFPKAFPDIEFHRGGSWENTIAYGAEHCEFVFEVKKP